MASKSEFAKIAGVTRGRVSQWIAEGKIGPDALVGEGRFAKIKVALALRQVRDRRDVGQSLGNGLGTQLGAAPEAFAGSATDDKLRQARLESLLMQNRWAEEQALSRRGRYVRADDVRAAAAKLVDQMMTFFDASVGELGAKLAEHYGPEAIPTLEEVWRERRGRVEAVGRRDGAGAA